MAQTTTLTLLTGDYPDRLNMLYAAAKAAEKDTTPLTQDEAHPADTLWGEYKALKAEAEAASEELGRRIVLEAIGRKAWRELKTKHPARIEGAEDIVKSDRVAGVNIDTAEDDLVYASLTVPKFDSRSQYDEWADALSEGEFKTILRRAWELANVAQHDPKSPPPLPIQSFAGD